MLDVFQKKKGGGGGYIGGISHLSPTEPRAG